MRFFFSDTPDKLREFKAGYQNEKIVEIQNWTKEQTILIASLGQREQIYQKLLQNGTKAQTILKDWRWLKEIPYMRDCDRNFWWLQCAMQILSLGTL